MAETLLDYTERLERLRIKIDPHLIHAAEAGIRMGVSLTVAEWSMPACINTRIEHDSHNRVYQASLSKSVVGAYALGANIDMTSSQVDRLVLMLRDSNNDAFSDLVDGFGADRINGFMKDEMDLQDTALAIRDNGTAWAGFTNATEARQTFHYLMRQTENAAQLGKTVRQALAFGGRRYGVKPRRRGGVGIMNKTGEDHTTVYDNEVGNVAVHHDVGALIPRQRGFLPIVYGITTSTDTVRKAHYANWLVGNVGAAMVEAAGGQSRGHLAAEAARLSAQLRRKISDR